MEIKYIKNHDIPTINDRLVACIGYFDGLHKGHMALVDKVKELAINNQRKTLITFYPDPKNVISNKAHKHIQSFEDRLKLMEKMGIELCLVFEFTKDLCMTTKEDFYYQILSKLPIDSLVCGFDFHYGYKGSGDYFSLKDIANFDVYMIDEVLYDNLKISSTRVKEALDNGDIDLVNRLLPYKYFINGKVTKGKRIGHKIGFPTINVSLDDEVLYPKVGVYLGYVEYADKVYKAMINIGYNETIASDNKLTIEAHILDFNFEIYGEKVKLIFNSFLRNNKRFDNLNELITQLRQDAIKAQNQEDYDNQF